MTVTVNIQLPLLGVFPVNDNVASFVLRPPLVFFKPKPSSPVTEISVIGSELDIALICILFPANPRPPGLTNNVEESNFFLVPFQRPI